MNGQLVVATNNAHKVAEIRSILAPFLTATQLARIVPLSNFTDKEPVEDGLTFLENSLIKSRAAAEVSGLPALADDSGITVDVLGGAPGIFSARWSGRHGDDKANRDLLLSQLAAVPAAARGCAFVSVVSLVVPGEGEFWAEGRVPGKLAFEARGEGGFGYDPVFIPTGYSKTTAQLTAEVKNSLSHRGIAVRELAPKIEQILR